LPRLLSFLAPGGVLAVQIPNVMQDAAHALMRMVAADGPWADRLVPVAKTRAIIGTLDDYYACLTRASSNVELWQTTYVHPLAGADAIVDWFVGSSLRPFLEELRDDEIEPFLTQYKRELEASYAQQHDGKVLLLYSRLFFVAQR
jgi:trans-aconitate 2-methyltransferase